MEIPSDHAGSVKIPPENTSCVISRNGMMDMAVVVLCTRVEIHSAIMSEE